MSFQNSVLSSEFLETHLSPLSGSLCEHLNCVRETCKIEVLRLDRWHNDRTTGFSTSDAYGRTDRLEVVQQEERRLVEAEVLDRFRDLSILDQERAVTRETGKKNRARI